MTAAPQATTTTIGQAINAALLDAMADDPRVVVLGEDVADPEGGGVMGLTRGLSTKFGDVRVRSTPIAEQAIIGSAIGAAMAGWRPVAEIMLMNFTTVAMDMIVNHAAKLRFMSGGQTSVPLVIRTMTGAGGASGGQHSDYLEAWFAHTAGLKVVAPSNPVDAYGLLRACIDSPDPCLFIENMGSYQDNGDAPEPGTRIKLGVAKVVRRGDDLTIVSYSRMLKDALAAAEVLAEHGCAAEVIDLRTIAPWDRDTVLASVSKTRRLLVVHEAVRNHGVGAEIAAEVSEVLFEALKTPVSRLGGAYSPVPFSKPLEDEFLPGVDDIVSTALNMIEK